MLAAYGAPVLALACAVGWLLAQSLMAEQRQTIAKRQAAADARMQEAERIKDEGEAMKQVARHRQEADERVEVADFRLKRSLEKRGSRMPHKLFFGTGLVPVDI
jgi:Tfp pilus assembly protein PilN